VHFVFIMNLSHAILYMVSPVPAPHIEMQVEDDGRL
jgi:hypothetical protein